MKILKRDESEEKGEARGAASGKAILNRLGLKAGKQVLGKNSSSQIHGFQVQHLDGKAGASACGGEDF